MHRAIITSLAAASLAIGIFASASAAPVKPPPPLPPPVPYNTWSGFYVGGLAGGAWGTANTTTSTSEVPGGEFAPPAVAGFNAAGPQSIKPGAFIGGLEAGYNWQPSYLLFGLEGDIEWLHFHGSANTGPLPIVGTPGTFFAITSNAGLSWLATARGRIGYAANNWLFYVTGGAAFTTLHGNFMFVETLSGTTEAASIASSRVGYSIGGGVETYLSRQWSVKAEYLFVDFGSVSTAGILPVLPPQHTFTHGRQAQFSSPRPQLSFLIADPATAPCRD
jgi:outer membrane immunogenic protein